MVEIPFNQCLRHIVFETQNIMAGVHSIARLHNPLSVETCLMPLFFFYIELTDLNVCHFSLFCHKRHFREKIHPWNWKIVFVSAKYLSTGKGPTRFSLPDITSARFVCRIRKKSIPSNRKQTFIFQLLPNGNQCQLAVSCMVQSAYFGTQVT